VVLITDHRNASPTNCAGHHFGDDARLVGGLLPRPSRRSVLIARSLPHYRQIACGFVPIALTQLEWEELGSYIWGAMSNIFRAHGLTALSPLVNITIRNNLPQQPALDGTHKNSPIQRVQQ
jgi:hypothetical protein